MSSNYSLSVALLVTLFFTTITAQLLLLPPARDPRPNSGDTITFTTRTPDYYTYCGPKGSKAGTVGNVRAALYSGDEGTVLEFHIRQFSPQATFNLTLLHLSVNETATRNISQPVYDFQIQPLLINSSRLMRPADDTDDKVWYERIVFDDAFLCDTTCVLRFAYDVPNGNDVVSCADIKVLSRKEGEEK